MVESKVLIFSRFVEEIVIPFFNQKRDWCVDFPCAGKRWTLALRGRPNNNNNESSAGFAIYLSNLTRQMFFAKFQLELDWKTGKKLCPGLRQFEATGDRSWCVWFFPRGSLTSDEFPTWLEIKLSILLKNESYYDTVMRGKTAFHNQLLSGVSKLCNTQEFSDVQFCFLPSGKVLYGHKNILAAGSRVFHLLFLRSGSSSGSNSAQQGMESPNGLNGLNALNGLNGLNALNGTDGKLKIHQRDEDYNAFEYIFAYLYGYKNIYGLNLHTNWKIFVQCYKLASKYELRDLTNFLTIEICDTETLVPDDLLELLQFGVDYKNLRIQKFSQDYIRRNFDQVKKSPHFIRLQQTRPDVYFKLLESCLSKENPSLTEIFSDPSTLLMRSTSPFLSPSSSSSSSSSNSSSPSHSLLTNNPPSLFTSSSTFPSSASSPTWLGSSTVSNTVNVPLAGLDLKCSPPMHSPVHSPAALQVHPDSSPFPSSDHNPGVSSSVSPGMVSLSQSSQSSVSASEKNLSTPSSSATKTSKRKRHKEKGLKKKKTTIR